MLLLFELHFEFFALLRSILRHRKLDLLGLGHVLLVSFCTEAAVSLFLSGHNVKAYAGRSGNLGICMSVAQNDGFVQMLSVLVLLSSKIFLIHSWFTSNHKACHSDFCYPAITYFFSLAVMCLFCIPDDVSVGYQFADSRQHLLPCDVLNFNSARLGA